MFFATINKPRQWLHLTFVGKVEPSQLAEARDEVAALLDELSSGFTVVTDLGRLDSMSSACGPEIGKMMELCEEKGVSLVFRVIPDPAKDIGLNIISQFHYSRSPRVVTCASITEVTLPPLRPPRQA